MPRRSTPVNVLLITVDTLRADAIGAYGNRRGTTPAIDRLAAAGVRFADAHAHAVTTLPSHASLLSGRYPTNHGVRDNSGFRLPATIETLATLLNAHGYRTAAFISAFPLDSRFGLDRGFDVYDDSFVDAQPRPAFLEQERRGTETVALAERWIDSGAREEPYFCWVHVYEPHFPYDPPPAWASRFPDDPYLAEVAAADAAIAPLLEKTIVAKERRPTLVVLTADHGESLGEHGEASHGIFAYEATLRVPLIVAQPERFPPHVSTTAVRHVDLLPTIPDVLALQPPAALAGRTLLPALARTSAAAAKAEAFSDSSYFEALSGSLNRGWAPLRGVVQQRRKFIDLPIPELYDLEADPGEQRNLAASQPRQLEEMRALLDGLRKAERPADRRAEAPDIRDRLRSLGYVGAAVTQPARYAEADDPKRLIGLDTLLQDVLRLYLAGDLRAAIARCRELIDRRPTMAVSWLELAHLERERGHPAEAIAAMRKAAALAPGDMQTVALLGAYLTQAGRAREAIDLLEPYTTRERPDPQLIAAAAVALGAAGRTRDAIAALERARRHDPTNAMLRVEAGAVYLMSGDRVRARTEFEGAVALNPNAARAHTSLGVMDAEDGRTSNALAHWRDALRANPREIGNLLAFAEFLQTKRNMDAEPYFELFATSAPSAQYAREIARVRERLARR